MRVGLPPAFQPFKRARKFLLLIGKANKILTNKLLCVTVTAKNQQHKFARAFERLKSWWKTYAHPCIMDTAHMVISHRVISLHKFAYCTAS